MFIEINLPFNTFSTKEFLSDAEFYLYMYRVYDPVSGRWTQRPEILRVRSQFKSDLKLEIGNWKLEIGRWTLGSDFGVQ